jgi:hypothetical protein
MNRMQLCAVTTDAIEVHLRSAHGLYRSCCEPIEPTDVFVCCLHACHVRQYTDTGSPQPKQICSCRCNTDSWRPDQLQVHLYGAEKHMHGWVNLLKPRRSTAGLISRKHAATRADCRQQSCVERMQTM